MSANGQARSGTTTAPQWFLGKHIYCCVADDHVVFLDLKHDEYFCLPPEQTAAFCSLLGIRAEGNNYPETLQGTQDAATDELAALMIESGFITRDRNEGKEAVPNVLARPSEDWMGYDLARRPQIRLRHIAQLLKIMVLSTLKLRCCSLEHIVRGIARRKLNLSGVSEMSKRDDLTGLRDLVQIFATVRPLFFTARNHCFFDCFALMEFLACSGYSPSWVFGVRMGPFQAHCWLQYGGIVLSDSLDHVSNCTPIMAV